MTSQRPKTGRIAPLDMTKGILVVFMVIYHSLNYSTQYYLAFRYLAFLPPSFIIITGFLLTHFSFQRKDYADSKFDLRPAVRGVKLLLLFTVLNIAGHFARSQNYHGPSSGIQNFFGNWHEIFFSGSSRLAIFEVLLPIAYLLILSPTLLWLNRLHQLLLPFLAVGVFIGCELLKRAGYSYPNLFLLSVGIIGMPLGRLSIHALQRLGSYVIVALLAYGAHFIFGRTFGQGYLHQALGATIGLAVVYGASVQLGAAGWIQERLIRLGQYSLIAYIGQIAILQVISHFAGRPEPVSWGLLAMLFGTLALTTLGVELVHWLRSRSVVINSTYRAVLP